VVSEVNAPVICTCSHAESMHHPRFWRECLAIVKDENDQPAYCACLRFRWNGQPAELSTDFPQAVNIPAVRG